MFTKMSSIYFKYKIRYTKSEQYHPIARINAPRKNRFTYLVRHFVIRSPVAVSQLHVRLVVYSATSKEKVKN